MDDPVAERTATLRRAGFRFGAGRGLDAKGKSVPIPARAAARAAADRARRRLPMIGRDADLVQLELVARRAFTERRPFLVTHRRPAGHRQDAPARGAAGPAAGARPSGHGRRSPSACPTASA